jgi:hypothetical protein
MPGWSRSHTTSSGSASAAIIISSSTVLAMAGCRYLALDAVTARPRLAANPQAHAVAVVLAQKTIQRPGRVGYPVVLPDLDAQAARRHRDNDRYLGERQGGTSSPTYVIRSAMTRLLCMRLRTGPTRRTLVRIAPPSGGHMGLANSRRERHRCFLWDGRQIATIYEKRALGGEVDVSATERSVDNPALTKATSEPPAVWWTLLLSSERSGKVSNGARASSIYG